MSLWMKILLWVAGYNLLGVLGWAFSAYEIGKHRGKAHEGARGKGCPQAECFSPTALCISCYILWPLLIILVIAESWHFLWFNGGVNATLPPENAYPVKPKDVPEIEWEK